MDAEITRPRSNASGGVWRHRRRIYTPKGCKTIYSLARAVARQIRTGRDLAGYGGGGSGAAWQDINRPLVSETMEESGILRNKANPKVASLALVVAYELYCDREASGHRSKSGKDVASQGDDV